MWHRITRDVLLFAIGAVGFLHELFIPIRGEAERPTVLIVCAALMGIPIAFRGFERTNGSGRRKNGDDA